MIAYARPRLSQSLSPPLLLSLSYPRSNSRSLLSSLPLASLLLSLSLSCPRSHSRSLLLLSPPLSLSSLPLSLPLSDPPSLPPSLHPPRSPPRYPLFSPRPRPSPGAPASRPASPLGPPRPPRPRPLGDAPRDPPDESEELSLVAAPLRRSSFLRRFSSRFIAFCGRGRAQKNCHHPASTHRHATCDLPCHRWEAWQAYTNATGASFDTRCIATRLGPFLLLSLSFLGLAPLTLVFAARRGLLGPSGRARNVRPSARSRRPGLVGGRTRQLSGDGGRVRDELPRPRRHPRRPGSPTTETAVLLSVAETCRDGTGSRRASLAARKHFPT